ncbi:MAG: MCP four helix bundle domain-containing protein [Desulfobacterales bacterium]|nr:MCP four helix bundle domain-containing protein [Desulfobacterales bacterium]
MKLNFFKRTSLRMNLLFLVILLVFINILGSTVTLWYTYRTQHLYTSMIDSAVSSLLAAQNLENALVMQKGFVTYYYLTKDEKWLKELDNHHQHFLNLMGVTRRTSTEDTSSMLLNYIESNYIKYVTNRDQIIRLYMKGNDEEGKTHHWEVRNRFFQIYDLCQQYKSIHETRISQIRNEYKTTAHLFTLFAWSGIPIGLILGLLLAYVLIRQILEPIKRLAIATYSPSTKEITSGNEVNALIHYVYHLMDDMTQTQSKLEKSREHLMQAEKLALVGKMAAGLAHSVRNPLTSVKMRLFSLQRSLELDAMQKEDFGVISEEIRHIDTIVQNFLEFSRPPKLKFQWISPSEVVDMTLQLLKFRIDSYGIDIRVERKQNLDNIMADAEQLKEVLVNLILNACEAMGDHGTIYIHEEEFIDPHSKEKIAIIRVIDTGPGIPESIMSKVFDPFFSSKEEGTGLGLSIAKRIIEEHGGKIQVMSNAFRGATFQIELPYQD